jgi:biotin carboxyl carrier protein
MESTTPQIERPTPTAAPPVEAPARRAESYPRPRDLGLPALRLVNPPRKARLISTLLVLGFLGGVLALVFVPWRQAVSGDGRVIGFSPLDRQQAIESPITGRVMEWFVQEGSKVKKGDPLARLADNDPDYLTRLRRTRRSRPTSS